MQEVFTTQARSSFDWGPCSRRAKFRPESSCSLCPSARAACDHILPSNLHRLLIADVIGPLSPRTWTQAKQVRHSAVTGIRRASRRPSRGSFA
ncbi:hypothetical protein C8Q76DRAFT_737395, partial [Earliella scabrosa]